MQLIHIENVVNIFRRALNSIDYRLVDHCERTTYIVYKMLTAEGIYSDSEILRICFLCTLHDIGAFKKEMVDSLVNANNLIAFEIEDTMPHCAYGYLFIKKFSPLVKYADTILYHHTRYDKLLKTDCENKDLAMKFFLADRIDVSMNVSDLSIDDNLFKDMRDTVFSAKDIDLVISLEKKYMLNEKIRNFEYLEELQSFYRKISLSDDEVNSFLKTLIYSIDFRSEVTVMHTITTVGISMEIAKLMSINTTDLDKIYYGALLHDIGKISTPIMILEKEGKLTDFEFTIMKDHVVSSERILEGYIDCDVKNIAIRHHEKLDGSGYPHGLSACDLNLNERIVAVSDILSALVGKRSYKDIFPKEKIKSILTNMANMNFISKEVVNIVLENYDDIFTNVSKSCDAAIKDYKDINEEYINIFKQFPISNSE